MEHKEWYKDWFNTQYYHLLYSHRNENEAEFFISNLVKWIQLPSNSILWDNACGKGRHAHIFAKYGYRVIGTDICPENINYANQKYASQNVQFFIHDMRREFYQNYFDLCVNLFTSIGYFQYDYENKKVIRVMANSLKKGGYLLIDFFNPKYVIENIVPHETINIQNVSFEINRNIQDGFVIKKIQVIDGHLKLNFEERVRLCNKDFFLIELNKSNIENISVFGDYDLSPFHENLSKRMIFLGRKG